MNWLSSFLHPERGYEKGQKELDRFFNQGQSYLQPYNQFGQNAYGDLSGAMSSLLNPQKLQDDWIKGYVESEAAKNAESRATQHGLDAASGLGLIGSSPALSAIQAGTTEIGLNDRQNYLDNLMQKYLAGAGIAGNIFNTGGNTASNLANNAMNMGNNSAQMAYNKENAPGNLFGGLLGLGGSILGNIFGGGIGNGGNSNNGNSSSQWNLRGG